MGPNIQASPALTDVMFCCHCLEMLNNCGTRSLAFLFCTESVYYVRASQAALMVKNPACQGQETQEMWVRSLGREDPLEERTAPYSSTFAWRTPWTEETGRPQSTGSWRVEHDWSNLACVHCVLCSQSGVVTHFSKRPEPQPGDKSRKWAGRCPPGSSAPVYSPPWPRGTNCFSHLFLLHPFVKPHLLPLLVINHLLLVDSSLCYIFPVSIT